GGVSWSTPTVGTPATVATEGETFVQFRARDRAGNVSAWAPALGDTGTVRIDRTPPSDPLISGGSLEWQNAASVIVSADGAIDIGGSGFAGYRYRTSSDGGVTWSSPSPARRSRCPPTVRRWSSSKRSTRQEMRPTGSRPW